MKSVRIFLYGITLSLLLCRAALADRDRPLAQSPYDPDAPRVELFAGLNDGRITAQVTPRGAEGGSLFLTNQTSEPLTVQMPAGFVGVPVKPQFGSMGPFGQSNQGSGLGNQGVGSGNSSMAGANGFQMIGGGTNNSMSSSTNTGSGFNSGNQMMNGFFSIPAGKTLRLPYTSVCLNHGLKEPTARTTVQLVPVEEFTADPVLRELIQRVGSGDQSQRTLQAAVWHVASGLSWQDLAMKGNGPVPVPGNRYFSRSQMETARSLVSELRQAFPATEQVADSSTGRSGPRTDR